jgi:hypothetical protein
MIEIIGTGDDLKWNSYAFHEVNNQDNLLSFMKK